MNDTPCTRPAHGQCSYRDCCAKIDDVEAALLAWTIPTVRPDTRGDAPPAYRDDVRCDGKRRYHANR